MASGTARINRTRDEGRRSADCVELPSPSGPSSSHLISARARAVREPIERLAGKCLDLLRRARVADGKAAAARKETAPVFVRGKGGPHPRGDVVQE